MGTEIVIEPGDVIVRTRDGERFKVSRIRDGLLLMYKFADGSCCEWDAVKVIRSIERGEARRLEVL